MDGYHNPIRHLLGDSQNHLGHHVEREGLVERSFDLPSGLQKKPNCFRRLEEVEEYMDLLCNFYLT